jgi:hypothetical protein
VCRDLTAMTHPNSVKADWQTTTTVALVYESRGPEKYKYR